MNKPEIVGRRFWIIWIHLHHARSGKPKMKMLSDVITIDNNALGRQKAVVRMYIYVAADNTIKSERKALRHRLDLMDSERVVVDAGDSVEVSDANTTSTSDAMDDVGDSIVPM